MADETADVIYKTKDKHTDWKALLIKSNNETVRESNFKVS